MKKILALFVILVLVIAGCTQTPPNPPIDSNHSNNSIEKTEIFPGIFVYPKKAYFENSENVIIVIENKGTAVLQLKGETGPPCHNEFTIKKGNKIVNGAPPDSLCTLEYRFGSRVFTNETKEFLVWIPSNEKQDTCTTYTASFIAGTQEMLDEFSDTTFNSKSIEIEFAVCNKSDEIPKIVLDKYEDLKRYSNNDLAERLSVCKKDNKRFYIVSSDVEADGPTFYYDQYGNLMGKEYEEGEIDAQIDLIIGYDCKEIKNSKEENDEVPQRVLDKYEEIKNQIVSGTLSGNLKYYNFITFKAGLSACKKNDDYIYLVSAWSPYIGQHYYYTKEGRLIGDYFWTDTPHPDDPKPPVNISDYSCESLKEEYNDFPILEDPGKPLENNYYVCKSSSDSKRIYELKFCGKDTCWSNFYDSDGKLIEETDEYGAGAGPYSYEIKTKVTDCKRTTEEYFKSKVEVDIVPKTVLNKYEEIKADSPDLGTGLSVCSKDSNSVYLVSKSWGYETHSWLYYSNGKFIGEGYYIDSGQESSPIDLADYDCKEIKNSKEENLTVPQQSQKFRDAGCTSNPLQDTDYINCENTSFVKEFGCMEPQYMLTRNRIGTRLEPQLALLECKVEGDPPYVGRAIETYFGCDGGFLYRCVSYVTPNKDGFIHIRNPYALSALIGPIETEDEALAFTLLSVIRSKEKLTFGNKTFVSKAVRANNGFNVTIYQSGSSFGCYDSIDHEEVTYSLTREGKLEEKNRKLAYNEKLQYAICVD